MSWSMLALVSAALLGLYDVFKKTALRDNAVLPVLLLATGCGAAVWLPALAAAVCPGMPWPEGARPAAIGATGHAWLMLKSVIVGSSWICAYFALKHLPITLASPIRASGPFWTLAGALLLFGERLNLGQWAGVLLAIAFYYLLGWAGRAEGVHFRTNRWVGLMVLATALGSVSALFDKWLLAHFDRLAVQAWYTFYLVPYLLGVVLVFWWPVRHRHTPFRWHPAIPLIGLTLAAADYLYFLALADPSALIAVVATLRRGSVVFSFLLGALLFGERNLWRKGLAVAGILAGLTLTVLSG